MVREHEAPCLIGRESFARELHDVAPDLFADDMPVVPNVDAALRKLAAHAPALVLVDLRSVGADSLRLLASHDPPKPATLVVGAPGDEDTIRRAVELGAASWLVAPFASSELRLAVATARHTAEVVREHEQEINDLHGIARLQESALRSSSDLLRDAITTRMASERTALLAQEETIRRLARAIESRSAVTETHADRIGSYCSLIAAGVGLGDLARTISLAAALHDVGTVTVPDVILLKRDPLTEDERVLMELHCRAGHAILAGAQSDVLELAAVIALTHHERYDGSGYPDGLAGDAIPIAGRIASIADAFDTLTNDWPFREALRFEAAAELLAAERGSRFDPHLLDVFLASTEARRIYARGAG